LQTIEYTEENLRRRAGGVIWMQNIRDYTELSAMEAVRIAQDRKDWKEEFRAQQCSYSLSRQWTRRR